MTDAVVEILHAIQAELATFKADLTTVKVRGAG